LFGASSEIGQAILRELPLAPSAKLTLIGRSPDYDNSRYSAFENVQHFQDDLQDLGTNNRLSAFVATLDGLDLVIVASAVLPQEDNDLDFQSVQSTMLTNISGITAVLSITARQLLKRKDSQLLYISSVAAIRPRVRNFTYGASKRGADFFALGLGFKYRAQSLYVTVLRPGFVFTKMSANFPAAPFATTPSKVAKIAASALAKRNSVVYAPRTLKYIMNLAAITPRFIFNRIG
jgi:decaprenylphospho-beta-D-erythro-pentofuranosid-2-ulose 2-reductase